MLAVIPFESEDDALRLGNGSSFGLVAVAPPSIAGIGRD
jgi:acyl-CoA reductase-like NAD-dependent aldehyde dehydrogenase